MNKLLLPALLLFLSQPGEAQSKKRLSFTEVSGEGGVQFVFMPKFKAYGGQSDPSKHAGINPSFTLTIQQQNLNGKGLAVGLRVNFTQWKVPGALNIGFYNKVGADFGTFVCSPALMISQSFYQKDGSQIRLSGYGGFTFASVDNEGQDSFATKPDYVPFLASTGGFVGLSLKAYKPLRKQLGLILGVGIQRHWMTFNKMSDASMALTAVPLELGFLWRL